VLERLRSLVDFVDVSVVAPVPYFPPWIRVNHHWHDLARIPRSERFAGVNTLHPRYVVFPKIGMATHGISMFAGTYREVARVLREVDYDLIDAHYVYPDGLAAALLAAAFKKPLVVSARGSDINVFPRFRLIRPLIQQVLMRAHGLIAVSHGLKEKMLQLGCGNDNVTVIGNGVDPQKFSPQSRLAARQRLGLPSEGHILISVGRLDENKGFHILIEAVSRLRASGISPLLMLVGEGPQRRQLQKQIREAGLVSNVMLVGAVPHAQLSPWYNAADVFCLGSALEGCPNVVLEAMACGRPVVATRVGGIPDLVVSSALGTLVDRRVDAFERALHGALHRSWDHEAIAEHARSHGWDKVSVKVRDVYSRAVRHFKAGVS